MAFGQQTVCFLAFWGDAPGYGDWRPSAKVEIHNFKTYASGYDVLMPMVHFIPNAP